MLIAIVIPVYNERRWVEDAVARVLAVPPPRQGEGADSPVCQRRVVVVDDGSTDGTAELVMKLAERLGSLHGIVSVRHEANRGKGAAIRTGFVKAMELGANVVLIHDADLEYDPRDHEGILRPILDGRGDVVIGSRFIGHTHRVLYYWHSVANKVITTACNIATNLNLTDIECCSKAFRAEVVKELVLKEDRFGIEPELIAKVARVRLRQEQGPSRPVRVYEVAVSYAGRTYAEGKKIGWKDGVSAIWCIVKYGVLGM